MFYNFLVENPVLAIIFLVIVLALVIFLIVKFVQYVGLEKIRKTVYNLFIEAEHEFQYGENEQKFDYVVQLARSAIPRPFNLFITKKLLIKVIQLWFDLCKDLLDDGKLNTSSNKENNGGNIYE